MPNERARNFEDRLDAIRQEAKHGITGRGVDVSGGPIPRSIGYYGEAVVKPPIWTWEIPLYFFVGGAAGMAPLIACAGLYLGQLDLMRAAASRERKRDAAGWRQRMQATAQALADSLRSVPSLQAAFIRTHRDLLT